MYYITNEVTMRLGPGQRVLEDSREQAIRGLIVGKVPSNLRHLCHNRNSGRSPKVHLGSKGQERVRLVAINYQSVICMLDRTSSGSLERSKGSENEGQSPEIESSGELQSRGTERAESQRDSVRWAKPKLELRSRVSRV